MPFQLSLGFGTFGLTLSGDFEPPEPDEFDNPVALSGDESPGHEGLSGTQGYIALSGDART